MLEISDEELEAINKAIEARYGIDFSSYEKGSFKRRVNRVINKLELKGVLELWNNILKKPDFIYEFINELTVGLTELFRNPDLWVHLRDEVLPSYKHKGKINIWHAGCSTGEEVYSTAITAYEAGLKNKTHQHATDINTKFLKQAEAGLYPPYLEDPFRKNYAQFNPHKNLDEYFSIDRQGLKVRPFLKNNIDFETSNLVRDVPKGSFELILCRNVMIYFDTPLKMKLLKIFEDLLTDDGYLIIGYFDAMPLKFKEHFQVADPVYKLFRKKGV